MTTETFEQMALRIAKDICFPLFENSNNPPHAADLIDFATRLRDELGVADQAKDGRIEEPVATLLGSDPFDERPGPWFCIDDATRLAALPAGTELFTHPSPAIPEGMVKDAERYQAKKAIDVKGLFESTAYQLTTSDVQVAMVTSWNASYDAAIDAAIAAGKK